jgi:hypothetical protein
MTLCLVQLIKTLGNIYLVWFHGWVCIWQMILLELIKIWISYSVVEMRDQHSVVETRYLSWQQIPLPKYDMYFLSKKMTCLAQLAVRRLISSVHFMQKFLCAIPFDGTNSCVISDRQKKKKKKNCIKVREIYGPTSLLSGLAI